MCIRDSFYFDLSEKKSAMALDLLMGTRGYRRFEWRPVLGGLLAQNKVKATEGNAQAVASFGDLRKGSRTLPIVPPADKAKDEQKLVLAKTEKAEAKPAKMCIRDRQGLIHVIDQDQQRSASSIRDEESLDRRVHA